MQARPSAHPLRSTKALLVAVALTCATLPALSCRASQPTPAPEPAPSRAAPLAIGRTGGPRKPPDPRLLAAAPAPAETTAPYALGPGDGVRVVVLGQPELSGEFTVGPDGSIALPLAGTLPLAGRTREECAGLLRARLAPYFSSTPSVAVDVTRYANNRAYVLGRVEKPGPVELTGRGNLLQALAEAGGLPVREFRAFLAKCAVIRGRDEIIWIDLLELLQRGNVALNVPLRNGDVVFIPDAEDATVFVMGEVRTPGAVPIRVRMTLTQAIAQAGGPTEDADLEEVWLVRDPAKGGQEPRRIDFSRILDHADFQDDRELQAGDIVYIARNGLGDVNYVLRKLQPGLQAVAVGSVLAK